MWFLLGTTLTASFFDSLNPSAIAQQMLLQAMVKKKRHIWFFICGIGTANLIMGLAIYYGIATWVSKFLTKIVNAYPLYVYGAAERVAPATSPRPRLIRAFTPSAISPTPGTRPATSRPACTPSSTAFQFICPSLASNPHKST